MSDALAVPNRQAGVGKVNPRLVQPEGFHAVGILLVYPAHALAETDVERVVRRHADQVRALLPRLPDGLSGLHAGLPGQLVFGEHDAVTFLYAAAHRYGAMADGRRVQAFDAGVKRVGVAMKNHPFHGRPSRYRLPFHFTNICSCVKRQYLPSRVR